MKEKKKDTRVQAKYVHVTLHKLDNKDKDHWLKLGMSFRENTVACLVGLEENHEEEKGLHAHIVMQFSTIQRLSRKQFVDHFGTDSLHIATKPGKQALLMALGYVSKTGNVKQAGTFTHRGVKLSSNLEVYRFQYRVKTVMDAQRYFKEIIKANLKRNKNIIKEYAERDDPIGDWLCAHPTTTTSLHKTAYTWYLGAKNAAKQGFSYEDFVHCATGLKKAYMIYLEEYPQLFELNRRRNSKIVLEADYADHATHELDVLRVIIEQLGDAIEYDSKRLHKSLNLYLWSRAPSFGKTRLLRFLDASFMAYRLPDDQWYVDYKNGMYQLLVSDEAANFVKTKSYSHLKSILEGEPVEFNLKGREKIMKEDNPLIVLADNISFDELMSSHFKGEYQPGVMEERVLDLELKSRATLHFFLDRCVKKNGYDSAQEVL